MTREPEDGRFTTEYFRRAGVALAQVDRAMQAYRDLAVDITGMSIRGPITEGGEFLATVRGIDSAGGKVVAFHSASSLVELVIGIEGKLASGTFRWKEDQWAR